MMSYRDTTFCASEVTEHTCGREFTEQDAINAEKWWGGKDYPVAYSEFCKEVDNTQPDHIVDINDMVVDTNQASEVLQGDCLELMKDIPDGSVDMILADLPYGTTACKWDTIIPFEPLWEQYKRIIKDNGAIVLTASQPFTSALVMSNPKMFKYSWYWEKEKGTGFQNSRHMPLRLYEEVLVFYSKKPLYNPPREKLDKPYYRSFGDANTRSLSNRMTSQKYVGKTVYYEYKTPTNRLKYARDNANNGVHPTQKPVALFEYLIKTYTNEGDLVLDNVAGSGTTGVAAQNLNRNFILMEQEPEYVEIIKKRLELNKEQLTKLEAEL